MKGCSCDDLILPVVTQLRFEMPPPALPQSSALLTWRSSTGCSSGNKKKKNGREIWGSQNLQIFKAEFLWVLMKTQRFSWAGSKVVDSCLPCYLNCSCCCGLCRAEDLGSKTARLVSKLNPSAAIKNNCCLDISEDTTQIFMRLWVNFHVFGED